MISDPDYVGTNDALAHTPAIQVNRPIRHLVTRVAGITYSNSDGVPRQDIAASCRNGEYLELHPERYNSPVWNAVGVYRSTGHHTGHHTGHQLGFVPQELVAAVLPLLLCPRRVVAYIDRIKDGQSIGVDILIVDGPPETTQDDVFCFLQNVRE